MRLASMFAVSARPRSIARFVPTAVALALLAGHAGCWSSAGTTSGAGGSTAPAGTGGAVAGLGGATAGPDAGPSGTGGAGGAGGAAPLASCDDIGTAPTIPDACATVLATKTVSAGIPTDESTLDTVAIQSALDACPAGQAVRLAVDGENTALLSGALFLRSNVMLWIDTGVTLFASRNPRDFDARANGCAGTGSSNDCNALINALTVPNSGIVGTGTIDGRGGELIIGGSSNWWDLENTDAGNLVAPRLVWPRSSNNFVLAGVTLRNAPKFHVVIDHVTGFKVWGITINTPSNSPNTDGVDPSESVNGVIAYNMISTGDDNIAIKASSLPISQNIIIAHNHFGKGHGMSIGSETNSGVQNIAVCDLSLDGSQNGLRIKSDASRGGLVQQIRYTDICMRNVGSPLVFDSFYSSATGTLIPWFKDVIVKNMHHLGAGKLVFRGWDAAHTEAITLDNVVFDSAPSSITASNTAITLGPGPVGFVPTGTTNVTVANNVVIPGTATPLDCTNAFPTF